MGIIIFKSIALLFQATFFILIVSCLLSWFPNIAWYKQPFKFFSQFSKLFFDPCRKIVPPIYGIDFSPILAFIILGVLEKVILAIVKNIFF